jgi:branched-chain amino acid aminotransferase
LAENIAYFNGEYVPESQVRIHRNDRGFQLGDTVFDSLRTFNGKIFRLNEHMDRLYRSLQYLRIDPGLTQQEMGGISEELVRRNEHQRERGGDWGVRQFVTRGVMKGYRAMDAESPTVGVLVNPIDFASYAKLYQEGARVVIPKVRSYSSDALDAKVKHFSRMNFALAQLEVEDVDPEAYPLLLDQRGNLSENVAGNIFLVTDGVLRTPRDSAILQGISRMVVLELAQQLNIPVSEEDLQPYDAYTADEAFLTNSHYCVLPVATLDKRRVNDEVPGPVTQQLLAAWSELAGVDIVDQAVQWARRHGG